MRNLQWFGFREADRSNNSTNYVYVAFFREMLTDNLGHGFDSHINAVLALLPVELTQGIDA